MVEGKALVLQIAVHLQDCVVDGGAVCSLLHALLGPLVAWEEQAVNVHVLYFVALVFIDPLRVVHDCALQCLFALGQSVALCA